MNLPANIKFTLTEFATLGRHEFPLASSLACLLVEYGREAYGNWAEIDSGEMTLEKWNDALEQNFCVVSGHPFRELREAVFNSAITGNANTEKAFS